MNTCINCKTIVDNLIEENNKEYDSLKIIYNMLSVERTILKNNSYLMMNILFFLINNYIGVITCENYLMNEEILNSHIEFMNLLIEKCNFILIYEKENINFELINEIYHLKDDKIYFKKIKYNTEKNKIEYTLEEPLERDDIDMKLWNIDDIYERKEFINKKEHNCNELIDFMNNELEDIQHDKLKHELKKKEIFKIRDKISIIIKNLIYIENKLCKIYSPIKKNKYFIKIIWGNNISDKIIQKNLLFDIIKKINCEKGIYLEILETNVFNKETNYLGWESID